jgi:hypothetical protein
LRLWLEEQGYASALAVPSTEVICVQTRAGIRLGDVASTAPQALRGQDWQRLSASQGTKGERLFDWARLPVMHAGTVDGRHWLVIRRCLDDPDELAYYLVYAPLDTPLSIMVQAIGARWHSEVHHLLAHLIWPTPTSAKFVCQWSIFRRTHQYWAGYYHRRRREKAGSRLPVQQARPSFPKPATRSCQDFSWKSCGETS